MECEACRGDEIRARTCERCHGHGRELLTGCPLDYLTPDLGDLLDCAALMRRGLLPVAGGIADQPACFMAAAHEAWRVENALRARLKLDPL